MALPVVVVAQELTEERVASTAMALPVLTEATGTQGRLLLAEQEEPKQLVLLETQALVAAQV
jgi:hypothetical protein